ncbi:Rho termination factor N-terminal domain-containing protein [Stutzerimonas urumqiensis]|uniref:Rho termination factor N-terminal domain-containing protein n=1 Tax=Stutzerimonas urumqiensis TaxID=638269 RepID=UPI000EB16A43|nr:Rho termination factor N-terminal domain-containing protein [Stutzerimonas urumqiensis]
MPRGDKSKYTDKQQRKAAHIEESYEHKGVPEEEAEARAWATVNKQSGGGERPGGSGRKKSPAAKKADREDSAQRAAAAREGHPQNRSSARADDDDLNDMTKDDLMKLARQRDISGRSKMRKDELVKALR